MLLTAVARRNHDFASLVRYRSAVFALDWTQILINTPWFALAAYLFGGEEQLSLRSRVALALIWGFVFAWIFSWALSVTSSSFPWNVIGFVVGWVSGVGAAVAPFVGVWRLLKHLRGGGKARPTHQSTSASSRLSRTAAEVLQITRDAAKLGEEAGFVATMLAAAGDSSVVTDGDLSVCRWPEETALAVAEVFYMPDAPLTRLRPEHVRSKWAAIAAYGRVQSTLLIVLGDLVSPPRYERAMRYAQARHGGDAEFLEVLGLARADLEEMKGRAVDDPVAAYSTGIYLRSILADEYVSTYFTDDAAQEMTSLVAAAIANGTRRLAITA